MHKWIGLIVLIMISCKSSDVQGNVMPVNEMKMVMWDMIVADEYANNYISKDSTKNLKQETLKLYSKVFAIHKISDKDFESSYHYYKQHPVKEKILLDSLQSYGNKMRESSFQKTHLSLPSPIVADTAKKFKF